MKKRRNNENKRVQKEKKTDPHEQSNPIFGKYEHFEVSKEPQVCQFFNTQLWKYLFVANDGYD
jgi:hypothetical protein